MLTVRGVLLPPNGFAGWPQHAVITHPDAMKVKINGAWSDISECWVKDAGAWRRFYKRNLADTAVGNLLSGVAANDPQMNDPTMLYWHYFWQNPAWTEEATTWSASESAIILTLSKRNPDGTAVARLGPAYPIAVNPGERILLRTMSKGTARFTLGAVTAPDFNNCDFFGTGAQWQEGAFLSVGTAAFEQKESEFVVPAGHRFIRPYASAYIQPDQPTGTRSITTQSFNIIRKA